MKKGAMIKPQWHFQPHVMGMPECTPLTEEFFKNGSRIESVVREAIQNSIDAKEKKTKSVRVRIYCSGEGKALSAKSYKKYRLGAEDRYADKGSGLVKPPADTEDCIYLVVEDFNTTGLTGDIAYKPSRNEEDRAKCNYYNYFFKVNDTSSTGKNSGDTLGSWGTGKATFTRASRLKTSFALTVRDVGEPRVFLAGKATLQVHTDEKEVTWDPDGWYGYEVELKKSDPLHSRAIPKRPVEPLPEKDPVAQFVKDFNLTRGEKNGTSIVIPHLVVEDGESAKEVFARDNLVRAVIRNFLAAILDGSLEVEVSTGDGKDKVELDAKSVDKYLKLLPANATEDNAVTRVHYTMVREVIRKEMPKSRIVDLKHVGKGQRPEWGGAERFKGIDLPSLKKTLKEGKPVLFNVPMSVLTKSEENGKEVKKAETDTFRVVLVKADLGRSVKPVFYRLGLLIDSVRIQTIPNYAAVVLVDRGPLQKVLVASEPPSHSEWSKDADKVKKLCYSAKEHIQFVTTAAREILEAIENSDKEADWDPLVDAFGIPDDSGDGEKPLPVDDGENADGTGTGTGDETGAGAGGNGGSGGGGGGGGHGDTGVPDPILYIEKIDEKDRRGFAIFVNAARKVEKYPCSVTFKFGFVPFSETGWSKYDFLLEDTSTIAIVFDPPDSKDNVMSVTPVDNCLTVTLHKQGAARVEVTGFEADRDLDWKKGPYKYGKEGE